MRVYDFAEQFVEVFSGNDQFYLENNIDLQAVKKAKKGDKVKSSIYFKDQTISESVYHRHLAGEKGLGLCPVKEDNTVSFGCIDIDNFEKSYKPIVRLVYEAKLPLFPCRSKSGGLHLYLFVKKPVQAKSMIQALEQVINTLGLRQTYGNEHVEIFPKQAKLSEGTRGNCITVPYFNAEDPVSYLYTPSGEAVSAGVAIEKFWKGRSSITELDTAMNELELSEAPVCVQRIILTSALGENSGRNNFLFTCAVFLKKKLGDDFLDALMEFNDRLKAPLPDTEVQSIFESVKAKEFNYKCKDIPCVTYCDRTACAKRQFGVGKDKGVFSGLDYGKLTRVCSEEPYYIWELKHMDSETYKPITFKDEVSLMDQKFFAKMCMRYLNIVPFRMQDNEWYKVLNHVLKEVIDKAVEKSTDTSEKAVLREAFTTFLTQKQAMMNLPVQVKIGFVYKRDSKYYFTHSGFEKYLDSIKAKYGSLNLREFLIESGAVSDTLVYNKKSGAEVSVPCWSKTVTDDLEELEDYYSDVFESDEDLINESLTSEESQDDEAESLY